MFTKKGVISLSIFSLLLLLFITAYFLAQTYYSDSKEEIFQKVKEQENFISASSFRSKIIELTLHENANLTYYNPYDSEHIELSVSGSILTATQKSETYNIQTNLSLLGIPFCSSTSFSPLWKNSFSFNGSCISHNN